MVIDKIVLQRFTKTFKISNTYQPILHTYFYIFFILGNYKTPDDVAVTEAIKNSFDIKTSQGSSEKGIFYLNPSYQKQHIIS